MKRENFDIANVLVKEIEDLKEISGYLKGDYYVYISSGASREHICISKSIRKRLLDICTEEVEKLEEKFERL